MIFQKNLQLYQSIDAITSTPIKIQILTLCITTMFFGFKMSKTLKQRIIH